MKTQEKSYFYFFTEFAARNIRQSAPARFRALRSNRGFTLLELMLVVAIIAILTAIFIPSFRHYQVLASSRRAMSDIRTIETAISAYIIDKQGALPPDLGKIGYADQLDPWGNHYVYEPAGSRTWTGGDLNDDYDLYSEGPNVTHLPSIVPDESIDDVIRADNGNFVGVAKDYGI